MTMWKRRRRRQSPSLAFDPWASREPFRDAVKGDDRPLGPVRDAGYVLLLLLCLAYLLLTLAGAAGYVTLR